MFSSYSSFFFIKTNRVVLDRKSYFCLSFSDLKKAQYYLKDTSPKLTWSLFIFLYEFVSIYLHGTSILKTFIRWSLMCLLAHALLTGTTF